MSKDQALLKLLILFGKWEGNPVVSKGLPKTFCFYVMEQDIELFRFIRDDPRILHNTYQTIQNAWKGEKEKSMGSTLLRKHWMSIALKYLERKNDSKFQEFIDSILESCSTESELQAFLEA